MSKQIEKIINETTYSLDLEVRNYSGRGMYGKHCLGIVCENPLSTILDLVAVIAEENNIHVVFEAIETLKRNNQDNMGRSNVIVYFPDVEYLESVHGS